MEKPEMHPLVDLLLRRMETDPEEFRPYGRWAEMLQVIESCGTEEEKEIIRITYGRVRMDAAHVDMMEELLQVHEEIKLGPAAMTGPLRRSVDSQTFNQLQQYQSMQNLQNLQDMRNTHNLWSNPSQMLAGTPVGGTAVSQQESYLKAQIDKIIKKDKETK